MKAIGPGESFLRAESPLGRVLLVAADGRLRGLYFEGQKDEPPVAPGSAPAEGARAAGLGGGASQQAAALRRHAGDDALLERARDQLREYFEGRRKAFDLPLDLVGTPFQRAVWQALLVIPYGETTTYSGIARRCGRPQAVRAVGGAIGRNPVSIVVPCHRVVGSDGSLTGFGGGLPRKRALLQLEGALPPALAGLD